MKIVMTNRGLARQTGAELALLETHYRSLDEVLQASALDSLEQAPVIETLPIENIEVLLLISAERRFIIAGLNYRAHCEEIGVEVPKALVFGKAPGTASHAAGADVIIPSSAPHEVDYEGEIGIVIGGPAENVAVADAFNVVAGLVAINDVSARDVQAVGNPLEAVAKAKGFATFKPHGPCMATLEEFADPLDIGITTHVNGEMRQQGRSSDMIFNLKEIISIVTSKIALQAGDVICTGTPGGVAHGGKHPYLKQGDEVRIDVEGLPPLINKFA